MLLLPALWLMLSAPPAAAHPFDSAWYGQKLEVRLQAHRVEVDYRVEVPARVAVGWLATAARADPDTDLAVLEEQVIARELDDLEGGLRLEVDGELEGWERLETPEDTGTGDERFVTFALRLVAELERGPRSLRIYNGNHPDERTLHHLQALTDDSVVIDSSSLYELDGGELSRDRTGEWRGEDELRTLTFTTRPRTRAARRLLGLLDLPAEGQIAPWRPASEVLVGASAGSALGLPGLTADELLPLGLISLGLTVLPLAGLAALRRRRSGSGSGDTEPLDRGTPVQ